MTYFSHFVVTREKTQKFLPHISHLHSYRHIAHPIDLFCLLSFAKIENLSGVVSLWCDSWCWFLFAPFCSNQLITKWGAKFRLKWLLLIFIDTNGKSIIFCKPRTLNDGWWRLNSIQKTNNTMLVSSSHFVFIGKFFYHLMALMAIIICAYNNYSF